MIIFRIIVEIILFERKLKDIRKFIVHNNNKIFLIKGKDSSIIRMQFTIKQFSRTLNPPEKRQYFNGL